MTCVPSPPPGPIRGEVRFPEIPIPELTYSAFSFVVWMDVPTTDPADVTGADFVSVVVETKDASEVTLAVLPESGEEDQQCRIVSIDLSAYVGQLLAVSLVFDTQNGIDNKHEGIYLDDVRLVQFGCSYCVEDVGCDDGDDCTSDLCLPFANDDEHPGYCWNEPLETCGE